eukprot:3888508-Ditylum_brightwellii.AAC.1
MGFRAYGTIYGFAQSIKQTPDPDFLATEDATITEADNTSGPDQLKTLRLHTIAMCSLTMAFFTNALMGLIYKAMIDNQDIQQMVDIC